MIYIPLSCAQPGMTLAMSISAPNGLYSLLERGQKLTSSLIVKLSVHNIDGIYIEAEGTEDINPRGAISPEIRRKLSTEFNSLYTSYYDRPYISSEAVAATKEMAAVIVDAVLDREDYLDDIVEIKNYDNYTYSHSLNVCILSIMLANELKIKRNRLDDLALCALMHDVGKIDIPIEIINKPGPVTDEEFEMIKSHPEKGVERLRKCYNISHEVLQGILGHHEKYDGSGYPYGGKGKGISLFARILTIADVYDALTSHRSYRKAWLPSEALDYISAKADTQFDLDIVEPFMHLICAYPTGTRVVLSDGSPVVVIKNRPENVLRPKVRLIEDTPLGQKGTEIDLFEDQCYFNLTIVSMYDK